MLRYTGAEVPGSFGQAVVRSRTASRVSRSGKVGGELGEQITPWRMSKAQSKMLPEYSV